jgi:hypothetical protein
MAEFWLGTSWIKLSLLSNTNSEGNVRSQFKRC